MVAHRIVHVRRARGRDLPMVRGVGHAVRYCVALARRFSRRPPHRVLPLRDRVRHENRARCSNPDFLRSVGARGVLVAAVALARAFNAHRQAVKPAPHLAFLDGLRAVAALSVLCSHVAWFTPALYASALYPLLYQGLRGVELFFVISGFCLSYPVIRAAAEGTPAGLDYLHFLAKRFARILPPYYAALALMAVASLTPQWHFMEAHLPWKETVPALHRALSGIFFFDRGPVLNGSFWTLGVEF